MEMESQIGKWEGGAGWERRIKKGQGKTNRIKPNDPNRKKEATLDSDRCFYLNELAGFI